LIVHANAKLGLAGRLALVREIERGASLRLAAARFGVSPATAYRWWQRWGQASEPERSSLACLHDRSSRPHRSPRRVAEEVEQTILRARRETNLGPGRLAGIVRQPRSTIWKVLHRHGVSRRPRGERQTYRRYEWSRPGALLHMDVKRLARFTEPGHRVTHDRHTRSRHVGWDYVHVVIDDHSRVAYAEVHPREDAATNHDCLARAVRFYTQLGCQPPDAVMTDNAMVYTKSRAFKTLLTQIGAKHITPPPFTPRWNGKAERFIRTLQDEWAYAHTWPDSTTRNRALPSFIRYYNRERPHSSLRDRPPQSRVHNLCGQDT
jgi:transposase InsO family protein